MIITTLRNASVKNKLSIIVMLTSSVALLLACIAFVGTDLLSLRRAITNDLSTLAEVVGSNSTASLLFGDQDATKETLNSLHTQPRIITAAIYDARGVPFSLYTRSGAAAKLPPVQPDGHNFSYLARHVDLFKQITLDNEAVGTVFLRLDMTIVRTRMLRYAGISSLVLLACLLVAFLISASLQRWITDPILHLAETARRITSQRNFTLRAKREGNDEIGACVDSFNQMLSEIQNRDNELEEHRNNLSDLVARRTAELLRANNELSDAKKRAESAVEKMTYQAYHDPLTNLPNRALLSDRLEHALERAHREHRKLAVLFLDLDRFKVINDSLGHALGDMLLCAVADRLKRCVRSEDTIARLGGDEFMVLLDGITHVQDAARVAEKIIEKLSQPVVCEGHELPVTTSIGISIFPEDGEDSDTLMKNADASMYRAKEAGRNSYIFYRADMNASMHQRLTMETALRKALENGEFELHYQPKVETRSEEIVAVEALVRWQRPGHGMVGPDEFINLAEETGLIVPLGEWVLDEACRQASAWQQNGLVLSVAVNISTRQLTSTAIIDRIDAALRTHALSPALIELEVTESSAMQNTQSAAMTLHELREMGIKLAIDDFGTGYSSLAYLSQLPIDSLKIDRSFVRNIPHNQTDNSIAAAIIAMAHNLRLNVVAEGVETREQFEFLRGLDCDYMQGYLFGRPQTADELEQRLRNDKGKIKASRSGGADDG